MSPCHNNPRILTKIDIFLCYEWISIQLYTEPKLLNMTSFYPNRNARMKCAFCHEAGHHVRDCSVLASNECGYCHNLGHTTRRCPVLAEKDQNRRRRASAEKRKAFKPDEDGFVRPKSTFRRRVTNQPAVISTENIVSTFSVLAEEAETAPKKKSGKIARPAIVKQRSVQGSWKKALVVEDEREPPRKPVVVPRAVAGAVAAVASAKPKSSRPRWADMADDESDSDDDDSSIFLC